MARLASILVLFAVVCAVSAEERIIGGTPTSVEQYPAVVAVESRIVFGVWLQSCGGTVLTPRYVMTAAGCVSNLTAFSFTRRVRAGTSYRNTGGSVHSVSRIVKHPSFRESFFDFGNDADIAILELENGMVLSDVIQQGRIVAQGSVVPDNAPVVQVGWGMTIPAFPGERSPELLHVAVSTINRASCAETYANMLIPRTVTENMICTAAANSGACAGDRGGPLFFTDIVVGIISWGFGCGNATYPSVNTAMASYTDWVVATAV